MDTRLPLLSADHDTHTECADSSLPGSSSSASASSFAAAFPGVASSPFSSSSAVACYVRLDVAEPLDNTQASSAASVSTVITHHDDVDRFGKCPQPLWLIIASFLNAHSLARLHRVSVAWGWVAATPTLWSHLYHTDYNRFAPQLLHALGYTRDPHAVEETHPRRNMVDSAHPFAQTVPVSFSNFPAPPHPPPVPAFPLHPHPLTITTDPYHGQGCVCWVTFFSFFRIRIASRCTGPMFHDRSSSALNIVAVLGPTHTRAAQRVHASNVRSRNFRFICDICRQAYQPGFVSHHCAACHFDVCALCTRLMVTCFSSKSISLMNALLRILWPI